MSSKYYTYALFVYFANSRPQMLLTDGDLDKMFMERDSFRAENPIWRDADNNPSYGTYNLVLMAEYVDQQGQYHFEEHPVKLTTDREFEQWEAVQQAARKVKAGA